MTPSAPLVLLPLGPGEFIALEPAELAQARERAREVLGPGWGTERGAQATTQSPEPLLTSEQISQATGISGPWFLEQARLGQIPHIKLGKYSRFRLSEVVQHGAGDATGRAGRRMGPEGQVRRGESVMTSVLSAQRNPE